MKDFGRLAAAGASFTAALALALAGGIWLTARTGQPAYIFAGLVIGLAVSGYLALRLLLR